jgi:hypothetical protein
MKIIVSILLTLLLCGCQSKVQVPTVTSPSPPLLSATPSPLATPTPTPEATSADAEGLTLTNADGVTKSFLLASGSLGAVNAGDKKLRFLSLTGDYSTGQPTLILFATIPLEVVDMSGVQNIEALKGDWPLLADDPVSDYKAFVQFPDDAPHDVTGGKLTIESVEGTGPWQVKGRISLEIAEGTLSGDLSTSISF